MGEWAGVEEAPDETLFWNLETAISSRCDLRLSLLSLSHPEIQSTFFYL